MSVRGGGKARQQQEMNANFKKVMLRDWLGVCLTWCEDRGLRNNFLPLPKGDDVRQIIKAIGSRAPRRNKTHF